MAFLAPRRVFGAPATPRPCPDCGSEHLGPPCGFASPADRWRTVLLDPSGARSVATEIRGKYLDTQAMREVFGEDPEGQMLDNTRGVGAVRFDADGRPVHRNFRTGEVETASEKDLELVMGGREE